MKPKRCRAMCFFNPQAQIQSLRPKEFRQKGAMVCSKSFTSTEFVTRYAGRALLRCFNCGIAHQNPLPSLTSDSQETADTVLVDNSPRLTVFSSSSSAIKLK